MPKANATNQTTKYVVLGDPAAKGSGFDLVDELGISTHYAPGDEFVPGAKWVELPADPGDNPDAIKFSVPYITNPEAKPSERTVSARTFILPVKKVVSQE